MKPYVETVYKYLRASKKFPHVWCAGCGNGIVLGALIRAIDELELDRDSIAMVSGIGCSSRTPVYADFNTLHTTHGRALTFATGIKLAKPELEVIVVTGDGDCLAIGGNHFIHACRRNLDITTVIYNNGTYGMTGGQYSPTTPEGAFGSTARYGNIEQPFDICKMAEASGASFVARATVYHTTELEKILARAIEKKGFSVVEILTPCPTYYGRYNERASAVDMLNWQKENTITVQRAMRMKPEEYDGKVLRGVLFETERPEYGEEYRKLIERAQGRGD